MVVATLVHKYLKSSPYCDTVMIKTFENVTGLSPNSPDLGYDLKQVVDRFLQHDNKASEARRSHLDSNENLCQMLVYNHLKGKGFEDEAKELKNILKFDTEQSVGLDLESVCHRQVSTEEKMKTTVKQKKVIGILSEQLMNTKPGAAEFTFWLGVNGSAHITYAGYDYSTHFNMKALTTGALRWKCRYQGNPLCKGCPGAIYVCWKNGRVMSVKEHSHPSDVGKMEVSSMGTSDSTIRYSKSRCGTPVLHYQGYEYSQHRKDENAKIMWVCRHRRQKTCKGYLHTKAGVVISAVREHSHLPIITNPQEKEESNKMISPLFL